MEILKLRNKFGVEVEVWENEDGSATFSIWGNLTREESLGDALGVLMRHGFSF